MKAKNLVKTVAVILMIALLLLLYYYLFILRRGTTVIDRNAKTVGPIDFLFAVYGPGSGPVPLFVGPAGVSTDRSGNIYVTDEEGNRVVVFDGNGNFKFEFGSYGVAVPRPGEYASWRPGLFNQPYGIDVDDSNGEIYVADTENYRVQVFDSGGKFLRWFPKDYTKAPGKMRPIELEVSGDKVYVTSRGAIYTFDRQGKYLGHISSKGRKPSQMEGPDGIAIDKDSNVVVSDKFLNRLQVFKPDGSLKWAVGKPPTGKTIEKGRAFGLPAGLDLDSDGNIYVVDAFNFTLQVYSPQGKKLAEVGDEGAGPAQFYFAMGEAVTSDNIIYVVDRGNRRVQALRINKFVIQGQD